MDRTPRKKSTNLSCNTNIRNKNGIKKVTTPAQQESQLSGNTCITSTPLDTKKPPQNDNSEESPMYLPCTQEVSDDIDVVWDWNSPQAKCRIKKKQKRLNLTQSPKIPIKRHPSNTQIQTFDKIREELQALREQISIPDNEDCLILSPVEEERYKYPEEVIVEEDNCFINSLPEKIVNDEEFANFFDDSVDEQLVLFSQKVESTLRNDIASHYSNIPQRNNNGFNLKANDSFDIALQTFKDDDLNILLNKDVNVLSDNNQKTCFSKEKSEVQYNGIKMTTGRKEFHRTQSFEMASAKSEIVLSKNTFEEIERKRKEALAKLALKKNKETVNSDHSSYPSTCSPEEIEQKRLLALAKLEAKRQQDSIEKKRQEALKKLQMNRLKNATVVKRL